jgi:uncharacterized membrane protein YsdA (DUF1294 family)
MIGISMATVIIYYHDKRAAIKNNQRVPEIYLHLLSLFGGWIAALIAQHLLRHKTKKLKFIVLFYAIGILQVIGLFLLLG